jgi:hypothetical protein
MKKQAAVSASSKKQITQKKTKRLNVTNTALIAKQLKVYLNVFNLYSLNYFILI